MVDKVLVRSFKYIAKEIKQGQAGYTYSSHDVPVYIHLFETKDGQRSMVINYGIESKSSFDEQIKRLEFYQMEIYPWIEGNRSTADIPSYKDALEQDFKMAQFKDTLKS